MESNAYTMTQMPKTDAIDIMVKDLLGEKLGIDLELIHNESSFKNDLGVDSLDFVEIIMELEKLFHIKIEDEAAENMTTVQSLTTYINEHIR